VAGQEGFEFVAAYFAAGQADEWHCWPEATAFVETVTCDEAGANDGLDAGAAPDGGG
jgi:hypothetical protein